MLTLTLTLTLIVPGNKGHRGSEPVPEEWLRVDLGDIIQEHMNLCGHSSIESVVEL